MREASPPTDFLDTAVARKADSLRWIWLVILVLLMTVLVVAAVFAPARVWNISQIILFVLTSLLCTLVAICLGVGECQEWFVRREGNLRPIATQVNGIQDLQIGLDAAVQQGNRALEALALQEAAGRQGLEKRLAELAGTLQAAVAGRVALGEALQAQREAVVVLAGAQGQSTKDIQKLQAGLEVVAGGVTEIGREQAAVRGALQEQVEILTASAGDKQLLGTLQQLQESARTIVGLVTESALRQAAAHDSLQAALIAVAAGVTALREGQTALGEAMHSHDRATTAAVATLVSGQGRTPGDRQGLHELTKKMVSSVADIARQPTAAPALGSGRLPGEFPPLRILAQSRGEECRLAVEPQAPVEAEVSLVRLHAAQAITHGEQIRYEAGAGRDNLGFWVNPSDWAQWDIEIPRPGRFKVTAQIAAVAANRFQVILADQTLQGRAPNTGDYGRFQAVEVGTVELASAGKTRVVVRPIPEGWQPMNLRSLDLARLPA